MDVEVVVVTDSLPGVGIFVGLGSVDSLPDVESSLTGFDVGFASFPLPSVEAQMSLWTHSSL